MCCLWRSKWIRAGLILAGVFVLTAGAALAWAYWYYVVKHPGEEFSRQAILGSLSVETPVYYDDQKSLMGVFFENEHRMYVPYDQIPTDLVNALVAAEDKNFFHHFGIDPLSILRASVVNLRAGKVVQGGSTLSQQTAKNLFKRTGRTFPAKLKEFVQTLRLEAHHSKQDIIEYFVNQFFVSGTGRGLGIAAKYFFDKPVRDLNLLECAFIAGSVRAPNRYNPLIQTSAEKRRETQERARRRTNYVLRQMAKLKMITPVMYAELAAAPIPFQKGKVYYQLDVVMDFVRDQLQGEKFEQVMAREGISNIATSGIKITTSVNRQIQEASVLSLHKNLSTIETLLSGYSRKEVLERYAKEEELNVPQLKRGAFFFGKAEEKKVEGEHSYLTVRIGDSAGRVDYAGLMRLAEPYAKAKKGAWAQASLADVQALLNEIETGDRVYVFIREMHPPGESEQFLADLEQKPRVEGAVLVMNRGKILAMVGGSENIFFNRAASAQRQLGSIFKPLVYTAAVQLGWSLLDALENRRDVFQFQDQFYFPRPDHESKQDQVSLAWAGVKSENLASVWLLYHLCDRLSLSQFQDVARQAGLAPGPDEGYYAFRTRMRDKWGIVVTGDTLREIAFQTAQQEIATDLIFEGRSEEAELVQSLKYGRGFDDYREALSKQRKKLTADLAEQGESLREKTAREYDIKNSILLKHFLRYERLNTAMLADWAYLTDAFRSSYPDAGMLFAVLNRFSLGFRDGREVLIYGDAAAQNNAPLTYVQAYRLFAENAGSLDSTTYRSDDVWIEGLIRSSVLTTLSTLLNQELARLRGAAPYEMTTLSRVRDYRVLVGLLYVVRLCQAMGIETPLDPVLSFPLGPNAVNLLEMSNAYSTLMEGKRYGDGQSASSRSPLIIDSIADATGKEIYRFVPQDTHVLNNHTAGMITEILRNVVQHGTGNKARETVAMELKLSEGGAPLRVTIPTLGKTGTANEYSNSSYIGVVPGFVKGKPDLTLENAFLIAVYVGFDDNTPMENGAVRIFGASGALPVWIDVANAVVASELYQRTVDPVDFAFMTESSLSLPPIQGCARVPVSTKNGLAESWPRSLGGAEPEAFLYSYDDWEREGFQPRRFFTPLKEQGTAAAVLTTPTAASATGE